MSALGHRFGSVGRQYVRYCVMNGIAELYSLSIEVLNVVELKGDLIIPIISGNIFFF